MRDAQLRRDVEDELEWDPSIKAVEIGVAVHEGIVTLTGFVPSYPEKLAAERAVKRVQGVKAVANDIEVRMPWTAEPTDVQIAQAALDALTGQTRVPADRIQISVSRGWIILEGKVDWQYQKTAAEDAVHSLVGVRGVTNQITIKPQVIATNVKSRIEAAFRRSAVLDAQKIRVESHDGKVTLRGQLPSWAERDAADRTAWAAPGVSEVENLIAVNSYTSPEIPRQERQDDCTGRQQQSSAAVAPANLPA